VHRAVKIQKWDLQKNEFNNEVNETKDFKIKFAKK